MAVLQNQLRILKRCNPYQSYANILVLCCRQPSLLTGGADTAQQQLFSLYDLARHRRRWRHQFEKLTPPLVALFLKTSGTVLARVQYLLVTDQSHFSLRTIIKIGEGGFRREFPEYEGWLRHH